MADTFFSAESSAGEGVCAGEFAVACFGTFLRGESFPWDVGGSLRFFETEPGDATVVLELVELELEV